MTESPIIIQIIGYSNSGKTTLIKKLLKRMTERNIKAATIKHHGHSVPLKPMDVGKDSESHRQSGALGSLVVSNKELQWSMSFDTPPPIKDLITFYKNFLLDAIIVEGYKWENYKKVVLIKNKEDLPLLEKCTNMKCIICWSEEDKKELQAKLSIPIFTINDDTNYIDWLINHLIGRSDGRVNK
ncbi:molybdopterin-guanine dinucleotide biosynthesis protein B [Evansella sp. AB-P1]|uniref:molybdopterin-guanine dinucleotide biosynthesis protein B n=1 Tax=Evansella sp. AB-P1 TaxID=3037653 RepID=UPI00241D188D|nr:molybdopterin-guanine dinucleotide biosynthesis protein B [Evansella sp. AB-P1]MDG5789177.1 molybdopterin-guanine dinucleotide biosynthesis protein B [Evansella sp. AB-P1]